VPFSMKCGFTLHAASIEHGRCRALRSSVATNVALQRLSSVSWTPASSRIRGDAVTTPNTRRRARVRMRHPPKARKEDRGKQHEVDTGEQQQGLSPGGECQETSHDCREDELSERVPQRADRERPSPLGMEGTRQRREHAHTNGALSETPGERPGHRQHDRTLCRGEHQQREPQAEHSPSDAEISGTYKLTKNVCPGAETAAARNPAAFR
jgi:hypothetical protein